MCSSTTDSKYNLRPDLQLEPGGGGPGLGAGEAGEGVEGDGGEQHGARAADLVTSALPPLPQAANLHSGVSNQGKGFQPPNEHPPGPVTR